MANQRLTGNSYTSLFPMSSIPTWRDISECFYARVHVCKYYTCMCTRFKLALSRNHPADEPLLLWPMVIFFSLPRFGASIVNLSSDPRSKLSLSLSSRLSPFIINKAFWNGSQTHWNHSEDVATVITVIIHIQQYLSRLLVLNKSLLCLALKWWYSIVTFTGSSFTNVRIWHFSSVYIIVNLISFGLFWSVNQTKS